MRISTAGIAFRNLFRKRSRTVLTVMSLSLSAGVLASLLGFNRGYRDALDRDIDQMGFQVLLTAKGCPYEAATLMLKGGTGLLLDVGANADCKPDNLVEFGVLGSLYAEHIMQIENPKVALMNIGEEDEKGNMLSLVTPMFCLARPTRSRSARRTPPCRL